MAGAGTPFVVGLSLILGLCFFGHLSTQALPCTHYMYVCKTIPKYTYIL